MTDEPVAVEQDDKAVIRYLQQQLAEKNELIAKMQDAMFLYKELGDKMNDLSGILFESTPMEPLND